MDDYSDLEMLTFENDENIEPAAETEFRENPENLNDRWASWVNIVNR